MRVLKYYVEKSTIWDVKVRQMKIKYYHTEALSCETIKKSCFPLCQTYKPTIILNILFNQNASETVMLHDGDYAVQSVFEITISLESLRIVSMGDESTNHPNPHQGYFRGENTNITN